MSCAPSIPVPVGVMHFVLHYHSLAFIFAYIVSVHNFVLHYIGIYNWVLTLNLFHLLDDHHDPQSLYGI